MIPKLGLWSLQACAVSYSYKKLYLLQVLTVRGMCVCTSCSTSILNMSPTFCATAPYIFSCTYMTACLCLYKAALDDHWGRRWSDRCVCLGSDSAFHIPLWYSALWPQETRPAKTLSLSLSAAFLSALSCTATSQLPSLHYWLHPLFISKLGKSSVISHPHSHWCFLSFSSYIYIYIYVFDRSPRWDTFLSTQLFLQILANMLHMLVRIQNTSQCLSHFMYLSGAYSLSRGNLFSWYNFLNFSPCHWNLDA